MFLLKNGLNIEEHKKTKLWTLIYKQLNSADSAPLNPSEIENYIYFGFSDNDLRPYYLRILLNYYSANQFRCESYYKKMREQYNELRAKHMKEVPREIEEDVNRTGTLNKEEYLEYKKSIIGILTVIKNEHPEVGYVHGFINILFPIYLTMKTNTVLDDSRFAEEDSYYLFLAVVKERHAVLTGKECKIAETLARIMEIVKTKDNVLFETLKSKKIDLSAMVIKWHQLMFCTEFETANLLWLWDRIFSDAYRFEILDYCCAAVLILFRQVILSEEYDNIVIALQRVSVLDVELLFDIADIMRREKIDILSLLEKK